MTSDSFIEVVQEAVDRTGMDQIPITDRTRLLSDNGPGYVSRAFRDYLGMVGIKHILATPFHARLRQQIWQHRCQFRVQRPRNQDAANGRTYWKATLLSVASKQHRTLYISSQTPSALLRPPRGPRPSGLASDHAIAYARLGSNVPGVSRIISHLPTQLLHNGTDEVCLAGILRPPDPP